MSSTTRVIQADDKSLVRGLGHWQALAIVVGAVVGTGIYMRPADIMQLVNTPTAMMLVWFGAGLLSLLGALTYADLAARIPRSGGEYAFLRVTLGELPAFLFGWMRLTVGVGSIAALSVAFTVFLADVFPLRSAWYYLALPRLGFPMTIELGPRQLIAVLVIAGLAFLNIRGVAKAGLFQGCVTVIKVIGLLGLVIMVALLGHASSSPVNDSIMSDAAGSRTFAYSSALLAAMAAYNGWAGVAMLGGRSARRTAQRSVGVGGGDRCRDLALPCREPGVSARLVHHRHSKRQFHSACRCHQRCESRRNGCAGAACRSCAATPIHGFGTGRLALLSTDSTPRVLCHGARWLVAGITRPHFKNSANAGCRDYGSRPHGCTARRTW